MRAPLVDGTLALPADNSHYRVFKPAKPLQNSFGHFQCGDGIHRTWDCPVAIAARKGQYLTDIQTKLRARHRIKAEEFGG
tara:strand:+ start:81266 stop:81505 length:240 start_codon:yes stop_codon:yes gene_type:complete